MRPWVTWICLCLALAGPFVVVARVAYGASLAIADAGQNIFEPAEDDADEDYDGQEMVAVAVSQSADSLPIPALSLDRVILHVSCLPSNVVRLSISTPRGGPRPWPPPGHSSRQSLLQSFRF